MDAFCNGRPEFLYPSNCTERPYNANNQLVFYSNNPLSTLAMAIRRDNMPLLARHEAVDILP